MLFFMLWLLSLSLCLTERFTVAVVVVVVVVGPVGVSELGNVCDGLGATASDL